MNSILKYLALYLAGEYVYTSGVKYQAIQYVNSIKGNKLNIGARGFNQISWKASVNNEEKCDIYPDSSKGIQYCNIKGPMPYYENKQFDVVFASHVLEHIEPEDVRKALDELSRIGKAVVIVLPHPLAQGFYTTPSHRSLIYKKGYGLYVRNNPLCNNRYYVDIIGLDYNIFKIYQ